MNIPEYNSKASPPPGLQAPTVSPKAAGAPFRGLQRLGGAVEDLGFQIQEQKDNISRTNELTTRITGAEKDIAELNNVLDQEQDPDTAMERFGEGFSEIRERWMDGVQDSKVLDALTKHFGNREYQEATTVKHKTLKWTIERGQANVIDKLDEYAKLAAEGTDIEFANNLDLANQLLDNALETGLYSPDKVVDLKRKNRKNFYIQRYNKMIQDDPEAAIRDFGWLRSIGDPKVELELLSKAVTWAQRISSQKDKDFKERSGNLLNRMILDINTGKMNREGVRVVVGSGALTDEHERILLNEISSYERSPAKSDPERLGYWKEEIEYAALRGDASALRSFGRRIHDDTQIRSQDRATLYATLQVKLAKTEADTKEFKDGYSQAIDEADRYCEYNAFERKFGNPAKKSLHAELIRKIQDASAGKRRNPTTGKIEAIPQYEGWELVEYIRRLIDEHRAQEDARRAQEAANEQSLIPQDNTYKRGK